MGGDTVCEGRMSAQRNMKRKLPSRRAMTAQSDRKMVRPRCEGREMRAKITPKVIAFNSNAKMDCVTMIQLASQQLLGLTSP